LSSYIHMKIKSLFFGLCFATTTAYAANAPQADQLLADLSRCDATFFETLGQRVVQYSTNPYFQLNGIYGSFQVEDRRDPDTNIRTLTPSLQLNNLEAVAYFDELSQFGNTTFLFWGFLLRASMNDVLTATRPVIWDSQRLKAEDNIFVRSEIMDLNDKVPTWKKIATVGNQAPRVGTIERVLLIEPYEKDPRLIRFGCSIQGTLTKELIRSERPDIRLR
jgi:hypothetical protein